MSLVPPRDAPSWLVDEPFEEMNHGPVKSGKEAQIDLVERVGADGRRCLLARKRYIPRHVTSKGQLEAMGFQRSSAFRHDVQYREGRQFRKSHDRRAVERMSTYGKHLLQDRWTDHEFDVMRRLWEGGTNVPYPVRLRRRRPRPRVPRRLRRRRPATRRGSARRRRTRRCLRSTRRRTAVDHASRLRPRRPVGLQPAVVAGRDLVHRLPAGGRHRGEPAGARLRASRRGQRVHVVPASGRRRRPRGPVRRTAHPPLKFGFLHAASRHPPWANRSWAVP